MMDRQTRQGHTEDQKAKVRAVTGKDAKGVELQAEELEHRIAPVRLT